MNFYEGHHWPNIPSVNDNVFHLRCFKIATRRDNPQMNYSDKVYLPGSVLPRILFLMRDTHSPMYFKIENKAAHRSTRCIVLEYTADEGEVYVPKWMYEQLQVTTEGHPVVLKFIKLRKATQVVLQAQEIEFIHLDNHKAVLEKALRNYSCLNQGDFIEIFYLDREYKLFISEIKPEKSASILNVDVRVDFLPPKGFEEYEAQQKLDQAVKELNGDIEAYLNSKKDAFVSFGGERKNRVDGKKLRVTQLNTESHDIKLLSGYPDENWRIGSLTFCDNFESIKKFVNQQNNNQN